MPHSRYRKKKRAVGALFFFPPRDRGINIRGRFAPPTPPGLACEAITTPSGFAGIPLLGGMPEPAALRWQNPGASGSSHRSSLRHGG